MVADGRLLDLIRRIYCFGMTLLKLDLRQESTRHRDAVDAITTFLGYGRWGGRGAGRGASSSGARGARHAAREAVEWPPTCTVRQRHMHARNTQHKRAPNPSHACSFKEWDEERKIEWLTEELATKRPLIPADMPMTDEVRTRAHAHMPTCPHDVIADPTRAGSRAEERQARHTHARRGGPRGRPRPATLRS